MFRAFGFSLIALAVFSLAGGHWAVLQTVAWAQMLRDYSEGATVAEAVEKTFSGEAPCSMCKNIAAARQQEKKEPASVKVEKKTEIFLLPAHGFLNKRIARDFCYPAVVDKIFSLRSDAPPVPVPIRVSLIA